MPAGFHMGKDGLAFKVEYMSGIFFIQPDIIFKFNPCGRFYQELKLKGLFTTWAM